MPTQTAAQGRKRSFDSEEVTVIRGVLEVSFHGSCKVHAPSLTVSVPATELGDALHGDIVMVELSTRTGATARGRIVSVLERPYSRLTGTFDRERGFVPDDGRFHRPLRCVAPRRRSSRALYGAELQPQLGRSDAEVRLAVQHGDRGTAAAEIDALLWREGIEDGFSRAALDEARHVSSAPHVPRGLRRDLRELAFVTIDPPDAEDHDDALFAERLRNGNTRCFVAIADVASLVRSGGALDAEARARGASLYLPGRPIPMLPRCISTDAASLLPGEDRRVVVLEVELDRRGRVCNRHVGLAVIRSRERLSYDEAADLLWDVDEAHPEIRRFAPMVELLDEVAGILRARRRERGALVVDAPAVHVEASDEGEPLRMRRVAVDPFRKRASRLVEELMLVANESVAELLHEAGAQLLSRAHPVPSTQRMSTVAHTAEQYGYFISSALLNDARTLGRSVDAMPDSAARRAIQAALLDVMPGAVYETERKNHFALATQDYVHFTSPIRRYPDLLVHRAVRALLLGKSTDILVDVEQLNERQQRARRIHRETAALYGALIAERLIGEHVHGVVTRVGHRDALVLADDPAVTIRCRTGNRRLAHGTRVTVLAERVDLARRSVLGRLLHV